LDLQTPHSRRREKVTPTHTKRDREKVSTIRKTSLSHNIRTTMRRRRRTWENGVNRHNTEECHSKQSLVAKLKGSVSEADSNSESNPEGGEKIIYVELSATVTTTKVKPSEPKEPEEGECLFHS
jgi:hypothetical protein